MTNTHSAIEPLDAASGYAPFERNSRQSGGVPGSSGSSKAHDRDAAHRLTHLDLFSGIGGFALAARWAGIETIGFSEIESYASKVLAKNFPEVTNYGDIRNIQSKIECDIITGGFPCQPFSLAGQRRGKADDRHIWPEMLRVVALCEPAWVLGENVPGIIGMELDNVLSDLEAAGYASQTFVVPACAVDARHRRNRVWIMAHRSESGLQIRGESQLLEEFPATERNGQTFPDAAGGGRQTRKPDNDARKSDSAGSCENVADVRCVSAGRPAASGEAEGSRARGESTGCREGVSYSNGESTRRFAISRKECREWMPEPDVGRVANGIPARVDRLKGLGNAIVPQVAFVFFDAIRRVEVEAEQAGASAHERTNKEHNGAQEHNDRTQLPPE